MDLTKVTIAGSSSVETLNGVAVAGNTTTNLLPDAMAGLYARDGFARCDIGAVEGP
jgi:hypothetical protein